MDVINTTVLHFFNKDTDKIDVEQLSQSLNAQYELLYFALVSNSTPLFQMCMDAGLELTPSCVQFLVSHKKKDILAQCLDNGVSFTQIDLYSVDDEYIALLEAHGIEVCPIEAVSHLTIDKGHSFDTKFWMDKLLYAHHTYWHSVEQYVYYKLYENTAFAEYIYDIKNAHEFQKIVHILNSKLSDESIRSLQLDPSLFHVKPNTSRKKIFQYLEYATHLKFKQNRFLHEQLIHSKGLIVTHHFYDKFGYPENRLGQILMEYRKQCTGIPVQPNYTNNMEYKIYRPKPSFYVVRGNPDENLVQKLNKLSTYKSKTNKIILGKYNSKLIEGGGWLVPRKKHDEIQSILLPYYPKYIQHSIIGKKWLDEKIDKIVQLCIKMMKLTDHNEISQRIVFFIIQQYYRMNTLISGQKVAVPFEFKIALCEHTPPNVRINPLAEELLWEFISNITETTFEDAENVFQRIQDIDHLFDTSLRKMPKIRPPIDNLVIHFIMAFSRVYTSLIDIGYEPKKSCMTVIDMLVGSEYNTGIQQLYKRKLQNEQKGQYRNEEVMFQERFQIRVHFLSDVLQLLPRLDKKCKLLLLTAIEYIENIQDNTALHRNLYILI